jgi:protein-L-isoaspartate(D-aspartate) O-methyltransferase
VLDTDVLDLLMAVKREDFVPAAYRRLAFADTQLPLGHGVAMLKPNIEAHALQALSVKKEERVLEVGTGSGFMAAALAAQAGHVWSVEIVPALVAAARDALQQAGVSNVTVEQGDGLAGLPAQAPFDAIMVSGAVTSVPQELLAQLKVGGRLFAFVGAAPAMHAQRITRVSENDYRTETLFETVVELLQTSAKPKFVF